MKRRSKDSYRMNLVRKVKHIPYGSQRCEGSEVFIKNTENGSMCVCGGIINKRKARESSKKEIISQLNE